MTTALGRTVAFWCCLPRRRPLEQHLLQRVDLCPGACRQAREGRGGVSVDADRGRGAGTADARGPQGLA